MIQILHKESGLLLLELEADDLSGADLAEARLCGADLRGANLTGAMLWRANLTNADLQGADLCGAFLLGAILWGAELTGVRWDPATRWPYDFDVAQLEPPSSESCDESGIKGCSVLVPRGASPLCHRGSHRVEARWGSCPHCLQALWATSMSERRRAAVGRARAVALCEWAVVNCQRAQEIRSR